MHHRHAAGLVAGLSFFAIGCQSDDAPTPDANSVTDSAGIEIVESVTPAWAGDGWRVSDTPSVVIGRVEGDERYLFGWINWKNGGVVLRDGRIAVLDGRSAQIRLGPAPDRRLPLLLSPDDSEHGKRDEESIRVGGRYP